MEQAGNAHTTGNVVCFGTQPTACLARVCQNHLFPMRFVVVVDRTNELQAVDEPTVACNQSCLQPTFILWSWLWLWWCVLWRVSLMLRRARQWRCRAAPCSVRLHLPRADGGGSWHDGTGGGRGGARVRRGHVPFAPTDHAPFAHAEWRGQRRWRKQ